MMTNEPMTDDGLAAVAKAVSTTMMADFSAARAAFAPKPAAPVYGLGANADYVMTPFDLAVNGAADVAEAALEKFLVAIGFFAKAVPK